MKALNTTLLAGLGLGLVAFNANALTIDTNGSAVDNTGGTLGGVVTTQVGSFDWSPGNAVIDNILIDDSTDSISFNLNYQARLGTLNDDVGNIIFFNGNLNAPTSVDGYEVTTVWTESFIDGQGQGGVMRFYLDTARNSNDLAGTGFMDGIEILTASTAKSVLTFDILSLHPDLHTTTADGHSGDLDLLDQSPDGDQLGGIQSIRALGSSSTTLTATAFDSTYFLDDLTNLELIASFNNSNILPYNSVNPIQNGGTIGSSDAVSMGAFNGDCAVNFNTKNTCSVVFQSDGNLSVKVPEPAPLALMSLGLLGLGLTAAKKRKQK